MLQAGRRVDERLMGAGAAGEQRLGELGRVERAASDCAASRCVFERANETYQLTPAVSSLTSLTS